MIEQREIMIRWETDPAFVNVMSFLFASADEFSVLGFGPKINWYKNTAPKTIHYHYESYLELSRREGLDCRGIDLHGKNLTDLNLQDILDYGNLSGCFLKGTGFQHASARYVDFSGSKFEHVQMSPIFAQGANFKNCVFEGGWFFGYFTLDNHQIDRSDLRECDFTNCKINNAHMSHTDLSQANFTNAKISHCCFAGGIFKEANFKDAQFESCDFTGGDPKVSPHGLVDMRGINFSGAVFRRCDFSYCQIDDTELARFVVGRGGNKGLDLIQWVRSQPEVDLAPNIPVASSKIPKRSWLSEIFSKRQ